ncbi:MAG: DUF3226 domain-containing protein [Bacteroidota bacterium]
MKSQLLFVVEGDADRTFLLDVIHSRFDLPFSAKHILTSNGWTGVGNQAIRNRMEANHDQGGQNVIIFDADDDCGQRTQEINELFRAAPFSYAIFLFPNHQDPGDLETLLLQLLARDKQSINQCWDQYEVCLQESGLALSLPNRKARVYAYLSALLDKTKQRKAKDRFRDYTNREHWQLDHPAIDPLITFLRPFFE